MLWQIISKTFYSESGVHDRRPLKFKYYSFAKKIIKNSKVELVIIQNELNLRKFVKSNIFGEKIVIGMGAGTITNWMRNLPSFLKWN